MFLYSFLNSHRVQELWQYPIRLCKLESALVVSFVAVKPTEWVVFGVLVFGALNA